MADVIFWLVVLAVAGGLAAASAIFVRAYRAGTTPGALLFKPRPDPRLAVVESANVDGKRRLLLVRRDDVEHLIMTGGPVDVVLETGIKPEKRREAVQPATPTATVFTRPPRQLSAAVGDGS